MTHIIKVLYFRLVNPLLFAYLLTICSWQQLNALEHNQKSASGPDKAVAAYCKADYEGATLSTENYRRSGIAALLWKVEEIGPAWDYAILVEGYRIASVSIKGGQSEVTVEYAVVGEWAGDVKIKKRTERHVFQVKQVQGSWKLLDPVDLPPHISVPTAIRHIEMLMRTQEEPEGPATIKKLKTLDKSANK